MSENPPSPADIPSSSKTNLSVPKTRRFAVEPIETSIRSSNSSKVRKELERNLQEKEPASPQLPKRFLPEPVETSFHSYRQKRANNANSSFENSTSTAISDDKGATVTTNTTRRFVPELIETSRRSKKAGDPKPATLHTDKADLTPGVSNIYSSCRIRKKISPSIRKNSDKIPLIHSPTCKPRRQSSMRPHCNTRYPTRQGSCNSSPGPTISSGSIPASESHKSIPRTPPLSRSVESTEDSLQRFQFTDMRESCDDRFSGYLLALAAKAADKQLREQALLAAYPNEGNHEGVEHFYNCEIENVSTNDSPNKLDPMDSLVENELVKELEISQSLLFRRRSSNCSWAVHEMQIHQDKYTHLPESKQQEKNIDELAKITYHDQAWSHARKYHTPNDKDPVVEKELQRMQSAANPPMLGSGLKFRICPSPKSTIFESDQKTNVKPSRSENGGGLWGGYCVRKEAEETPPPHIKGLPLIHTPPPKDSLANPFLTELEKGTSQTKEKTPSLPGTNCGARIRSSVSERLDYESTASKIEDIKVEEFDDHFVTQVYNYLSLGYPSVAWQFDDELSHISKIPIEALRLDDKSSASGHIGLKDMTIENEKTKNEIDTSVPQKQNDCQKGNRWRALKLYILEWGRQHPSLNQTALGPSAWGVTARRGSWAI